MTQKEFAYRARDQEGTLYEGFLTAENETSVASVLRSRGLLITQIRAKHTSLLQKEITLFESVTLEDLAVYVRQFSVMIDASMPLLSVLQVLVEQTEKPRLREATQRVLYNVQSGETLAQAMHKHPKVFPNIMVSLVEAGELGGVLNEVLERLATHLEKEHKMRQKIKGALTYPAVVMTFAMLIVTLIITFVLPIFEHIFENSGVALPFFTQVLLRISFFIRNHYLMVVGVVISLIYGISRLRTLPQFRPTIDQYKLRLPLWGDIGRKVAVARFCRTLATMLHGGVNILAALDVVKKVTDNSVIENTIARIQIHIKEGHGLAMPLLESRVFPSMVVRMIAIGEETGKLDCMLVKVADFFESEVEDKLNNFSKILEPVLIFIVAVIIGLIVLSIMLPMFEISSAIR